MNSFLRVLIRVAVIIVGYGVALGLWAWEVRRQERRREEVRRNSRL